MEYLNGRVVPEDYALDELRIMLESSDMQTFTLACEALKNIHTAEAYCMLKSKLQVKDKYRYRYILSVIFSYEESSELKDHFINAMQSDDKIFVSTALNHLILKNLWVTDEQILSCFERNHNYLDCYYYQILLQIAKTELHGSRIIKLLKDSKTDSARIAIAECLTEFALKENYVEIYRLLADSSIPKIRLEACRTACKFNRIDLLQIFSNDSDGHIRKYVNQALKANEA